MQRKPGKDDLVSVAQSGIQHHGLDPVAPIPRRTNPGRVDGFDHAGRVPFPLAFCGRNRILQFAAPNGVVRANIQAGSPPQNLRPEGRNPVGPHSISWVTVASKGMAESPSPYLTGPPPPVAFDFCFGLTLRERNLVPFLLVLIQAESQNSRPSTLSEPE